VIRRPPEFDDPALPLVETEAVPLCAVCGAASFKGFARGYDYELLTCRNEWTFVRCDACGHVWLNPRPAVSALGVIYPPHYYAYDYESRVSAAARWGKALLDRRKLDAVIRKMPKMPRTFLDIGCGSGRYLRAMAARGLEKSAVHGLELNPAVVSSLASEGYAVECARVEDAALPSSSIDFATMFHVLEHVDAPDRVVSRIADWLTPGGVLAIETPNLDSLDQRLFAETYWGGYHIPRHWHLFTEQTLARLVRAAGLEPVAMLYQTGHSFWMYSVHHWLRYREHPWPRLARRFDPFTNVLPLAVFTAFDRLRGLAGARTSAMLMLARKPGASDPMGTART
jgi:2-polyprenyl-3-methyl-5-hydroxy-6-metoxy-1,4-benzoquinol methylase